MKQQLAASIAAAIGVIFVILVCASGAHAQAADQCAATYVQRYAQTVPWLKRYLQQADYAQAEGFFTEHCRFLERLEIIARHLDDQNSYVCEPGSKPPKNLTAIIHLGIREGWWGSGATWDQVFVEAHPALQQQNEACAQADAAERAALALPPVDMRMPYTPEDGDRTEIRAWKQALIAWMEALKRVADYGKAHKLKG